MTTNPSVKDNKEERSLSDSTESNDKENVNDLSFEENEFVKLLKHTLRTEPDKYIKFLELVKNYHLQKIQFKAFEENVKDLFEDKPDLLEQLKIFIPSIIKQEKDSDLTEKEIKESNDKRKQFLKKMGAEKAMNLLVLIKTKYIKKMDVLKKFYEILLGYERGISRSTTINNLLELFKDQPECTKLFVAFLLEKERVKTGNYKKTKKYDSAIELESLKRASGVFFDSLKKSVSCGSYITFVIAMRGLVNGDMNKAEFLNEVKEIIGGLHDLKAMLKGLLKGDNYVFIKVPEDVGNQISPSYRVLSKEMSIEDRKKHEKAKKEPYRPPLFFGNPVLELNRTLCCEKAITGGAGIRKLETDEKLIQIENDYAEIERNLCVATSLYDRLNSKKEPFNYPTESVIHRKYLLQLYGNRGVFVKYSLIGKPQKTIPIVSKRLQEVIRFLERMKSSRDYRKIMTDLDSEQKMENLKIKRKRRRIITRSSSGASSSESD